MSYVHLHFHRNPEAESVLLDAVLVDVLGRSSVPLLSVFSGYFFVGYLKRRGILKSILGRLRSLVLPMLCLNLAAVALWGAAGQAPWDALLAVTEPSHLIYLTFLRDLFVLSLLAPLLIQAARRWPLLLLVAVSALYVANLSTLVVLRPQIAFFFCIGILLAVHPRPMPRWAPPLAFAGLAVALAVETALPDFRHALYDNLLLRPATALSFWLATLWAVRALPLLGRIDAGVYAFFLTHGILFHYAGAGYKALGLLEDPVLHLALWLATPALTMAAVLAFWAAARSGGREPAQPRPVI